MADTNFLVGLQLLVVGLGREGVALATYLAKHGLKVTATDLQSEEKLGSVAASLREQGVTLQLGEHPISLLDKADILFVSPGVPLEIPFLQQAMLRKIPLSTESRLFCHLCSAPIVAITGTSGKTTTTTLVAKIMEADHRRTWVGGNIGQPLIGFVDQIEPTDAVVMELSSFQLEYFHARLNKNVDISKIPSPEPQQLARLLGNWSPPISAILNIKPNHLDRHPSMKHYIRAKRAIIDYQDAQGVMVMSLDNDMTRTIGNHFRKRVRWFSQEAQVANGAGLVGDMLALFDQNLKPQLLVSQHEVKLRGPHNINNILAACLLAREAGASPEAMRQVITSFTGVEHRLQLVREHQGILYYNDSISTSPDRLIAALHSFNEPIVLLVGGRDKHLPWEEAAWLTLVKTRDIIIFGEAAELIAEAIELVRPQVPNSNTAVHRCKNLEEAVSLAAQVARSGDVVLLSPGCASFDAFRNFAERGDRFKELVLQL
jgi:UDP-N-acetylmuramoylalanine--D-glutamate ligase